jgi:glucose-6-phosphate 1-epimerase
MHQTAEALRHREIPGLARIENSPGGLVRLVLTPPAATLHVYLQGAHVTHFQPAGEAPLLFLSKGSAFQPGKAIRGGVPVIFPWFGARQGHPESAAHGFARTLPWEIETLESAADGEINLSLVLAASDETRREWPHDFLLRHRMTCGRELRMTLEVENRGNAAFDFEEALHTYLAAADARQTRILGLAGSDYLDKVDGFRRKVQEEAPIRFTGETDRVYLHTAGTCTLEDPAGGRSLQVAKEGSATTVVWNPWIEKAAAMADFGDDEWPLMACIETANAAEDAVTLAPGARHAMTAVVSVSDGAPA